MPSVMMRGMQRLFAMIIPLMKPKSVDMPTPAAMASGTLPPPMMIFAITTAAKTMMLPIERSIPPEMSRSDIPIVRIPTTEICCSTIITLPRERKRGLMEATTMQSRMMMIHSRTL